MKIALDLKEIGEIVAAHLRAKGYKLKGRYMLNVSVREEKVQLTYETED